MALYKSGLPRKHSRILVPSRFAFPMMRNKKRTARRRPFGLVLRKEDFYSEDSLSLSSKFTMPVPVPRFSAAHCAAACRPFGTSTPSHSMRHPRAPIANRTGKAFQLLSSLLMITWITFGPIIDPERENRPNKPKNCRLGFL